MGWFTERFRDAAAFLGNDEAQQYVRIRDAERPSVEIMNALSQQPGMNTPENLARIQTITRDGDFMKALDSAIKSDNSIITRLADSMQATGENGAPQDPSKLLEQLANGTSRGVMTQFLGKIGQSADDKFDGTYLDRILNDAQKKDYISLNKTAQEMGIESTALSMGAMGQSAGINFDGTQSPLDMVGSFIRNPDQAIGNWIDNPNGPFSTLDDNSKNMVASLVKMLAGFMNIYMPGNGIIDPYLEFGQKYGGVMAANGQTIRDAAKDVRENPAGENNITVADSIRPARGGSFMTAALGKPAVEPDADVRPEVAAQRVEREVRGMSMGGGAV